MNLLLHFRYELILTLLFFYEVRYGIKLSIKQKDQTKPKEEKKTEFSIK